MLLTIFMVLYFISPLMKLLRLVYNLIIISSKSKPDELKKKFGEWAVVTGATDGLGKEYAKELAKRDLNLVLISRSIEKLNQTKEEIQILNLTIHIKVIEVDFSRGRFVFEKIRNELKDIIVGILVNNVGAGFDYPMYLGEMTESKLWEMIMVNIGAATGMTHLVIEDMKTRGKGAIVNICSGSGSYPCPLAAVYASTKTFLQYFTDAIREEYSKDGITLQRLSPYYIDTKMVAFSPTVKHHRTLCPSPSTYVRSAIQSLGKLDSTSGYWLHEVIEIAMSMLPALLKKKIILAHAIAERTGYLQLVKEKILEVQIKPK